MKGHDAARFWDGIAQRYARKPVPDEAVYQRKLEMTRACFRPDTKVFEFGCGTGSTAIAHAPHVECVLATDVSAKMLEIARQKARDANVSNVRFEQAAIDDFEAPDAAFDAVLGLSILHLLEDRDAVIARVYRMLKPGGVFVSSTACLAGLWWLKLIAPLGRMVGLLPFVGFFSREELEASLTGSGFEIDQAWRPKGSEAVFIVARKPARA